MRSWWLVPRSAVSGRSVSRCLTTGSSVPDPATGLRASQSRPSARHHRIALAQYNIFLRDVERQACNRRSGASL